MYPQLNFPLARSQNCLRPLLTPPHTKGGGMEGSQSGKRQLCELTAGKISYFCKLKKKKEHI
jgi:hypothetical protein